ncbi:MAG: hypothetical protein LUF68_07200 [Clostridiales bacterium]|nr:hypothetical protein [Clostridiales bacterium]
MKQSVYYFTRREYFIHVWYKYILGCLLGIGLEVVVFDLSIIFDDARLAILWESCFAFFVALLLFINRSNALKGVPLSIQNGEVLYNIKTDGFEGPVYHRRERLYTVHEISRIKQSCFGIKIYGSVICQKKLITYGVVDEKKISKQVVTIPPYFPRREREEFVNQLKILGGKS